MTENHFGPDVAERYDRDSAGMFAPETLEPAVDRLEALAAGRPALELAIGTGRVGLALAARGVPVTGIELSEAMVEQLRAKPGGDAIPVTIGDFAAFELDERFRLIYVVFNTFFAILTQAEQVEGFAAIARHLAPDGAFAMQAFVPDQSRFDAHHQRTAAISMGVDHVALEVSVHDAASQRTEGQYVVLRDGRIEMYPVQIRYAYVSELDLMARRAGLRLRERWADWHRTPFGSNATNHISVWERG